MKNLNFAAQPENGGYIIGLTGFDLTSDVVKSPPVGFLNSPLFVDNCSFNNKCKMTKNFDFGDALDIAKIGASTWSADQQRKADEAAAQKAAEIAAINLQIEQQKTLQAQTNATKSATSAKSYVIPMVVGGVIIIASIATYFIFKKKK